MGRLPRALQGFTAALVIFVSLPGLAGQQARVLSSLDDITVEFKEVPCRRSQRLEAVRTLFMRMGASESDITTEKFRDAENLVVKRQGRTDDTIILGAHYDFVETGCGAIDNWSGIVALAHVYKSVRAVEQRKTVLFVAFDNEEKGLVGARAMANAIANEDLPRYCAMINVDSLGLVQPFAMKNASSPSLMKLAEDAASAMGMSFRTAPIDRADADSSAFLARRVPAITFAGLSGNWSSILHSKNDQKDRIDGRSVYLGYRLTLEVWNRIDQSPCDTFRK